MNTLSSFARTALAFALVLPVCFGGRALGLDFNYEVVSGTEVRITGYSGPGGTVTVPASIKGLPVRAIGDGAFWGAPITSILLPKGIERLEPNALRLTGITELTLPNSLKEIGEYAFADCEKGVGRSFLTLLLWQRRFALARSDERQPSGV